MFVNMKSREIHMSEGASQFPLLSSLNGRTLTGGLQYDNRAPRRGLVLHLQRVRHIMDNSIQKDKSKLSYTLSTFYVLSDYLGLLEIAYTYRRCGTG